MKPWEAGTLARSAGMASSDAREFAASLAMAEALDEYAPRTKRRRLPDGIYYTEKETKAWYYRKAQQMWDAGVPKLGEEEEDEVYKLLVKALLPTPARERNLSDDGLYCRSAAVLPATKAVEGVSKLVMHYRNKALQNSRKSTSAAEPGVRTRMPAPTLEEPELEFAWAKWRTDYKGAGTGSFEKYVQDMMGDTYVAKALIQHGVPTDSQAVADIIDTILKLRTEARNARGGAAEPAETRGGAAEPAETQNRQFADCPWRCSRAFEESPAPIGAVLPLSWKPFNVFRAMPPTNTDTELP